MRLDKPNCVKRARSPYGIRSEKLVNIAKLHGVTAPEYLHELPSNSSATKVDFIENKVYDFQRISELLELSISQNHHANGGPITKILQQAIKSVARLSDNQMVLAVFPMEQLLFILPVRVKTSKEMVAEKNFVG